MKNQRKLILALGLALFAASANADSLVYVVTVSGQFGTVNTTTGGFTQIGAATADPLGGLVQGPNGLLGVSFSGNLESVNSASGAISIIGATGLGYSALDTAELGGTVYETDFSNNLYQINTNTGAATLIAYTGIPGEPVGDECDEALFAANGKLFATFDAFNPTNFSVVISPKLYQIDPSTGLATLIGSTSLHLNAALDLNGSIYAFQGQPSTFTSDEGSLNLTTGSTTFLTQIGSEAAFIDGAAATPEPSSIALAGMGMIATALVLRRRARSL
jgi:hypothetical protein